MQKPPGKLILLSVFMSLCGLTLLGMFFSANVSPGSQAVETTAYPPSAKPQIRIVPGKKFTLTIGKDTWQIASQAATVGDALTEAGVPLHSKDRLSLDLQTPLRDGLELTIEKARQVWVEHAGLSHSGITAARSVGEALADLGLSLQGLDYSEPSADSEVPTDGRMVVHRVGEAITLMKEETPAGFSYEADPETPLDQQSTLIPAVPGYTVTRSRTRMVDGQAQQPVTEGPWKASEPKNGVIGLGSKVVVYTEVVDGVELNYWRKLSVYATGYKPSSNGGTGTASGIPLTKGIIAVEVSWYNSGMAFQKAYVPGYGFGTIADTGPNILGHPWIDLGFDDDNYVSWHNWTTLYLLEPVPSFVPLQMP
ncbi:MAG TPA: ubiquitin-like domain-containing protein [Anaerolineaceae bacterium]|nr:ubiquitin-like domain-containing protein [Anaerolineaceae bacterium]